MPTLVSPDRRVYHVTDKAGLKALQVEYGLSSVLEKNLQQIFGLEWRRHGAR